MKQVTNRIKDGDFPNIIQKNRRHDNHFNLLLLYVLLYSFSKYIRITFHIPYICNMNNIRSLRIIINQFKALQNVTTSI